MKAKLIKLNRGYYNLEDEKGNVIGTSYQFKSSVGDAIKYKLSQQNCDEIFGVVDVDKLTNDLPYAMGVTRKDQKQIWMDGFNKAMELNKDKLFNQYDVLDVVNHVLHEMVLFEGFDKQYLFPETVYHEVTKKCSEIKNKPTEIEVEIEMESEYIRMGGVKGVKGSSTKLSNPAYGCKKTDENGCLILKKI
jgi:hypothetical protein